MFFFSWTDILKISFSVSPKFLCNQHWYIDQENQNKKNPSNPLWTRRNNCDTRIKRNFVSLLYFLIFFFSFVQFSFAWYNAGKHIIWNRYTSRLLQSIYYPCNVMYDAFRSVSIIYFDLVKNAVPDNYASAKLAFVVHPFKVNVPKNSSTPYDRPMLKEFITTFILMYLTCHVRYLPF